MALGAPGHEGDPEAPSCPKETIRGAESSGKGLARMQSPGRHFPQEQWETLDLHSAGQHITQRLEVTVMPYWAPAKMHRTNRDSSPWPMNLPQAP